MKPEQVLPFGTGVVIKKDTTPVNEKVEGTTLDLWRPHEAVKAETAEGKCQGKVLIAGPDCKFVTAGQTVIYFKFAEAQAYDIDKEHILLNEEMILAEVKSV